MALAHPRDRYTLADVPPEVSPSGAPSSSFFVARAIATWMSKRSMSGPERRAAYCSRRNSLQEHAFAESPR